MTIPQFQTFAHAAADAIGAETVTIINNASELSHYDYPKPSKASDILYLLDGDYFICSAILAPRNVPDE